MPFKSAAFAALKPAAHLVPYTIERRDLGASDVHIHILYTGICHSDLHHVRDEWYEGIFPMVPGHEIVGRVAAVGKGVKKVQPHDIAAVGCFVESCGACQFCSANQEQHCAKAVLTYSGRDSNGEVTYGGYSCDIVVTERFVCVVPPKLHHRLANVAPLMCAGITTWSAMKRFNMDTLGKKIGVIGLGGLGHMAVQFGVAFGNEVTVISTSETKKELALGTLHATKFINSKDEEQMRDANNSLDFLIDTVSAPKDINAYFTLLKPLGVLVSVGMPPTAAKVKIDPSILIPYSKTIAGSKAGGLAATQEMLDFCGERNIVSMVEIITMDKINEAYGRLAKGDVKFRFSIDIERSVMGGQCSLPSTQASRNDQ